MVFAFIVLVFIARCYIIRSIVFLFTAILLVLLLVQIRKPLCLKELVSICSLFSMEIWFVHSYFNQDLFADYFYSFKVPILTLAAMIIMCIVWGWYYSYLRKLYEQVV